MPGLHDDRRPGVRARGIAVSLAVMAALDGVLFAFQWYRFAAPG